MTTLAESSNNTDFQTRRTNSYPKRSLFGSQLEIQDPSTKDRVRNLDLEEYKKQKLNENKKVLPDSIREKMPDSKILKLAESSLQSKILENQRAIADFEETKLKALRFHPPKEIKQEDAIKAKPHQWHQSEHLQHSDKVNAIGFGKKHDFNYDRNNRKQQQQHTNNSAMADLLQDHDDFFKDDLYEPKNKQKLPLPPIQQRNTRHSSNPILNQHREKSTSATTAAAAADKTKTIGEIEIPKNLLHKFGTQICQRLLSDNEKVSKILNDYETNRKRPSRYVTRRDVIMELDSDENNKLSNKKNNQNKIDEQPPYESLGRVMRFNIFPGCDGEKISEKHRKYTELVFQNREPVTDKYRAQKDQITKWSEKRIVNDRVMKAWRERDEEKKIKK